eukprot:scaffold271098_cov27-Tisochrysis_lutea.AAC.4
MEQHVQHLLLAQPSLARHCEHLVERAEECGRDLLHLARPGEREFRGESIRLEGVRQHLRERTLELSRLPCLVEPQVAIADRRLRAQRQL